MNKTQKSAWFILAIFSLVVAIFVLQSAILACLLLLWWSAVWQCWFNTPAAERGMNRAQKIAWFNIIVMVAGYGIILLTEFAKMPAIVGVIELVIMLALACLSPLFFRKKPGRVDFDERDYLIREKALFVGLLSSYSLLAGGIALQYFKVGPDGLVPVDRLLEMLFATLFGLIFGKSFVTLTLYAKGSKRHGE